MLIFIDNFDSFSYNIVHDFLSLGCEVEVYTNDCLSVEKCIDLQPTHIILGPGPKTPKESGVCQDIVHYFSGKIPLLGICLGHQVIGAVYGADITQAPYPRHGKTSPIVHGQQGLYQGCIQNIPMMRYHSLVIEPNSLPPCLAITSSAQDDFQIMGISHKDFAVEGVQFHPESFLSVGGITIFQNFLEITSALKTK